MDAIADDRIAEDVALVRGALDADAAACERLVRRVTPIVQHRACRAMACSRSARLGRPLERSDMLDLTQQLLLLLFDNGAAVLASWDPARGLSLDNFIGLVAEREARAILRSGRRSAWAETPTADDILEACRDDGATEHLLAARDELTRLWLCLENQLSPRGIALFRALLVDEKPVPDVCNAFGMSETAVYNFRSRVRRKLRELQEQLEWSDAKVAGATRR